MSADMAERAIAPWDMRRDDAVWRLLTNPQVSVKPEAQLGRKGGRRPVIICIEWRGGLERFHGVMEAAEWLGVGRARLCHLTANPHEIIVRGRHYRIWAEEIT